VLWAASLGLWLHGFLPMLAAPAIGEDGCR
jgi:hypothetical protein